MFILTQFSPLGLWWTLSVQYISKDVQTIFFFFHGSPLESSKPPPGQLIWESAGLLSGKSRVLTPAGPTLRVLKQLRRNCCLYKDIYKWLDFLLFSDEDKKPQVPCHSTFTDLFFWDVKEPTPLFEKSRGRWQTPAGGVVNLYGLWDGQGWHLVSLSN